MRWQDFVIGAISIVFALGLVPSIRGSNKPAILTSLVTSIGLTVMGFVDLTLHLWITAVICVISGVLWGVLLWQGVKARESVG